MSVDNVYVRIPDVHRKNDIMHVQNQSHSLSNPQTTTVRPKTQFSDGYFISFIQKPPIQGLKSRKKEGFPPQISAISLIFGIAILR